MPTLNLSKKELELLSSIIVEYENEHGGYYGEDKKLLNKIKRAGKRIAVQSAKGKGRALQQKVCQDVSEAIGIPYDQQDDECLIHSREMGQAGVDVILRGEAKRLFPFAIECKSAEQFSLSSAIIQAQNNTVSDTSWMIVHKRKAWVGPVVILSWNIFIEKCAVE